ncbi:MAG: nucleotidyltransferase domain-containing protein [Paraprevotella sp.]|nr:nucleotidyltransferase domain-containing protein [Paraprevotella sp.]
MCTREQCIERLRESAPYIRQEFGVESMCLFGSMARGDNREDSDVDVCVSMPPKAFKLVSLKDFLQHLLGVAVDVVRRTPRLDPFLLSEIERDGVSIFS